MKPKKALQEQISGPGNQGVIWTQRSKRQLQMTKITNGENEDNTKAEDPLVLNSLLELYNSTLNPLKVQKLLSQFLGGGKFEFDQKVSIINEVLGNQHAIFLFFKLNQTAKLIINNEEYNSLLPSLNELIRLQHIIFEVISQNNKLHNLSSGLNLSILKIFLLNLCEQYAGYFGRVDEVLQIQNEISNLSSQIIINEIIVKKLFDEFQVDPDQIYNLVTQSCMRSSVTITILSHQIKSFGFQQFQQSFRQIVQEVQQLESQIFSFVRQGQEPILLQLKNLILAYIIMSEQLNIANFHGIQGVCLEILGKSQDVQTADLQNGFLRNALRFTQKYMNREEFQQFSDKIVNIYKKAQLLLLQNAKDQQIQQNSQDIQAFLCQQLSINYLVSPQSIEAHKVYDIIQTLSSSSQSEVQGQNPQIRKISENETFRSSSKNLIIKQVTNNNYTPQQKLPTNEDQTQEQLNINRSISSSQFNQNRLVQYQSQQKKKAMAQSTSFTPSHQTGFSIQSPIHANRRITSNTKSNHDQGSQSESQDQEIKQKRSNDDYEYLMRELRTQKQELQIIKTSYQKDISQKKIEIEQNTVQVDKMQSKIDTLETTIQQLRSEGGKNKREKDVKESEVYELRVFIIELQEKQKKLEKLVQIQSEKPLKEVNIPEYKKADSIVFQTKTQNTSMNIQIPDRSRQQSIKSIDTIVAQQRDSYPSLRPQSQFSHSPVDELYLKDIDETSPNMKSPRSSNIISLLDGNTLENNVGFSKLYTIHQSNLTYTSPDVDIWETQFFETNKFKVDAQFIESKEEGRQIQLRAFLQPNAQQVATEFISLEILRNLLSLLEVSDVLPSNMPQSSIQNTHLFFKHLILPFVAVTQQDEQSTQQYKIQIWPKAPGFFSGLSLRIEFLDVSCLVFFHHIESDQFRVLLCDPFSMEGIKLDIELDYSSMDYFFQNVRAVKDDYIFHSKSTLFKMTNKTDVVFDDNDFNRPLGLEDRHFIKSNPQKSKVLTQGKVFNQESLISIKSKEFLIFIKQSIQHLDTALKSQGITAFSQLQYNGTRFFKYKTWNNGTKGQIQIIRDNAEKKGLEVFLRNSHETFGPEKTKLRVQGITIYKYESILRDLALNYEKLVSDEKLALIYTILYSFNLTVFDKATEYTEQNFDRNPIVQHQFVVGQYKRSVIRDQFGLTTLSISVVGIQKRMLGIKFSLYDVEDCCEHGVFLSVTQNDWDVRSIDKQSKFKSSVENIPFSEYFLMQIFKDKLFLQIIFKKIFNTEIKNKVVVQQGDIKKRKSFIEKVDNYISYQEVLTRN